MTFCLFYFRCDNVYKLQQKLDYLKALLDDPVHFKNIYRYAFDFARVSHQTSTAKNVYKDYMGLFILPDRTLNFLISVHLLPAKVCIFISS